MIIAAERNAARWCRASLPLHARLPFFVMKPAKLRILICDDHDLVRDGLIRILVDAGVGHMGEAATAEGALEAVRREKWDLVILDLNLDGRSGLEPLKELKQSLRPGERPLHAAPCPAKLRSCAASQRGRRSATLRSD